ncbi:branchpoint-bridging protein-like [Vigna radiata var. radiata]|uniref:Branchpoint-bridging protein-like n=1 Tax=Vigna radiata var. radiata TaxID=3916 RepID=A0A1S3UAN6_VIGRR|nr:branchpoint-bridging protein-like [Vigna radiata var. radiata]
MTGEGSDRPNKGKGIARPKKRQRQSPKYVLRVPATLPTPTTVVHPPPTTAVDPPPTTTVHLPHTTVVHPPPTATVNPPPPIPTAEPPPPHVIITPTPPPNPTSIPSSSCRSPSNTVTPSADSAGDGLSHLGLLPRPSHDQLSNNI